jgi:hypothetical protein
LPEVWNRREHDSPENHRAHLFVPVCAFSPVFPAKRRQSNLQFSRRPEAASGSESNARITGQAANRITEANAHSFGRSSERALQHQDRTLASQAQGDAKRQALLDKRTRMLKTHQRLGLITTIPLIATVATSLNAGGKNTSTASRDLHTALGGVTGDLYFLTAYYAIRAPRVPGTETRGPIRFHKVMAWIHGPGMIATPILGIMAFDQKNKGEKVHGIAQAHGPVAIVTAGAFGAALLSVSVKF